MWFLNLILMVTSGWAGSFTYDPLQLHELIARADVCVIGEIVAVGTSTVQVQVEQLGFGDAPGPVLTVKRFRDWTCARRWTPYAVGQRCLYFLDRPSKHGSFCILGAGGEGESPMISTDLVRLQAVDAEEALGNRTTSATALLAEARRYRGAFRQEPAKRWIEPAVGADELEAYRASSALAAYLCQETYAGSWQGQYHDPVARSPRAAEAGRIDLGVGDKVTALAALPDLDGDGHGEILCAQGDALELLRLDGAGAVRARDWIRLSGTHYVTSAAPLGDLDGDRAVELALGEGRFFKGQSPVGRVSVVSLAASGAAVRAREFGLAEPAFGQLAHRPEGFGHGVAYLGDLDGDGTAELAVSAGVSIGLIWIVSLDALGAPVRVSRVLGADAAVPAPLALAALGDLDGDGVMDLAASAPARWGSGEPGTLVVFLLERDGSVRRRLALHVDSGRGTTFGTALAGTGDWDGDGVPDLAVGAPYGTSCVVLLGRDGGVKAEHELATGVGPLPEDSGFGCALAARPATAGRRLLVAGHGAKEPGPRKWKSLRCYPALWGFGP